MKTIRLLFSDAMARAIVEGRKTVTRRPVVCPGWNPAGPEYTGETMIRTNSDPRIGTQAYFRTHEAEWHGVKVPCVPGDLLIGRECWRPVMETWRSFVEYRSGGDLGVDGRALFVAERGVALRFPGARKDIHTEKWHPSIHMPDWAARIRRRVVSVTVERLQGISRADVLAEGCDFSDPREFAHVWDSIYTEKGLGWSVNPWAWRIEFSKESAP